jgi:hypothetical protein
MSFPFSEKIKWLVVNEITIEIEEAINVLFSSWCLRKFMTTGQDPYGMTPFCQTLSHLMAPLGVAT